MSIYSNIIDINLATGANYGLFLKPCVEIKIINFINNYHWEL